MESQLTFHPSDKNVSRTIYFPDEDEDMDDFEEEILEIEEKKNRQVSLPGAEQEQDIFFASMLSW
jgi:hypothetical protein